MIAVGRDDSVASEERRHVVIKHLMDYGASPTLDLAIQADDYRLVDFLMCVGNYRDEQDDAGSTVFHRAAESMDSNALNWLLAYGADPSLPNADGYRPLHFAVQSGDYETVRRLLCDFKVDPSVQDNNGVTPLHLSTRHIDLRITFLLLYFGAREDDKDVQGLTPDEWANYINHYDIQAFILCFESSRPYVVDERFITTLGSHGPVHSWKELQMYRGAFGFQIAGDSSDDDAASARKTLIEEFYSEIKLRAPTVSEQELERRLHALRN
jgi:ankyrin repeat protein